MSAVEASYVVALRIAKAKKPHTIADDWRRAIPDHVKKLNPISLSNDTVARRIADMSSDILIQVVEEIKSAPLGIFSVQLDESTDVVNCSQLLVYVRYIKDDAFKEEYLFCKPLETTTTARDVYNTVNEFLIEHKLLWKNVCGVCTDGAPSS